MNGLARHLGQALGEQASTETLQPLVDRLLAQGRLIGLLTENPETWFKGEGSEEDSAIDALVAERDEARAKRNFARADEIRDELTDRGIVLEDGAGGTRWRRGS